MKQLYTLLFALFTLSLSAQISITKFSLPYVGSTLKTYTSTATTIDLGTTEGPQVWNFTSLAKDNYQETLLEEASEGSVSVANADFVIKSNATLEQYYSVGEDIQEIFIKTVDPLFAALEISSSYADNPVYRKGTIEYQGEYESSSRLETPFAWADLPDTLTGGTSQAFDSVRFNTTFEILDEIDAYGTVQLPDGDWNALRESRRSIRSVGIDVFFFGSWIPAPGELLEAFLGDFADLIQPDTTYSYNFYTDQSIEVLASISLDDEGNPQNATYKAGSEITETFNPEFIKTSEISVYPNPSFGSISFNFEDCRPGVYTIQVMDILGKEMWKSTHRLGLNKKPLKADLSFLRKGTYLYTVHDPLGNKIATKRLVIITP